MKNKKRNLLKILTTIKNETMKQQTKSKLFKFLTIAVMLTIVFFSSYAFADTPFSALDDKGGELTSWLTGGFMTIMGTVALVVVAVMFMAGKMTWIQALTVMGAIIFGMNASTIINALR